jgi:hypothetical protein
VHEEEEEEVDTDQQDPYILQNEVETVINKWSIRKIQEMMMYLWMYCNWFER